MDVKVLSVRMVTQSKQEIAGHVCESTIQFVGVYRCGAEGAQPIKLEQASLHKKHVHTLEKSRDIGPELFKSFFSFLFLVPYMCL